MLSKLPHFHFMFFDRYEINIQDFADFLQGYSSYPVPVFTLYDKNISDFQRNNKNYGTSTFEQIKMILGFTKNNIVQKDFHEFNVFFRCPGVSKYK